MNKYFHNISVSFLLSWTPYTIVSFYVAYGRPETIDPLLSRSAALVAKSQVLWNPILYIGFTDSFRKCAYDIIRCRKRNRPRDIDLGHSRFSSNRTGDGQAVTIGGTLQRIFTVSGLSSVTESLNVFIHRPKLTGLFQKKNLAKKKNKIESLSDCQEETSGNYETIGEDGGREESKNKELQAEIHSDVTGTSSIIDVKPECSQESSKDNLELPARVKTRRTMSSKVEDDSLKNKVPTETSQRSVSDNSTKMLRTEDGDVELHVCDESSKSEEADVTSIITPSASMSKSYGIVINVVNADNELIPID